MYLHALDLSLSCPGISIFTLDGKHILTTHLKTNPKEGRGMRLHRIGQWLSKLKQEYPPSQVAIEGSFVKFNNESKAIQNAVGVFLVVYREFDPVEYQPNTVKAAIVHGHAKKEELWNRILEEYPSLSFENDDESDSYAVGLCFLIKKKIISWNKPTVNKPIKTKKSGRTK